MVVIKHYNSFPVLAGTTARLPKTWWRLHLLDSLLCSRDPGVCGKTTTCAESRSLLVPSLKFHLQGLPTQRRNGCISHVQVLAELKSLKQGDFRVERKKCLPSTFSLQRPKELQAGVSLLQQQWQTAIQRMKKRFQMLPFCHITLPQGENLAAELENCRNWVKCF